MMYLRLCPGDDIDVRERHRHACPERILDLRDCIGVYRQFTNFPLISLRRNLDPVFHVSGRFAFSAKIAVDFRLNAFNSDGSFCGFPMDIREAKCYKVSSIICD